MGRLRGRLRRLLRALLAQEAPDDAFALRIDQNTKIRVLKSAVAARASEPVTEKK